MTQAQSDCAARLARDKGVRLALLAFAMVVVGCAPTLLNGRVSAALYAPPPSRANFTIAGADVHVLSLTERQIQTLLAEQMIGLGFTRATGPDSADLVIQYSYNIGAGSTQISSQPDFVSGGQRVSSSMRYPSSFQVTIVDLKASRPPETIAVLWQGELYSVGNSADIGTLSAYFIPEIFRSFGKSEINRRFTRVYR